MRRQTLLHHLPPRTVSWLLAAGMVAAGSANSAALDEYLIDTWRSDNGLPNNAVTSVLQTRDGYLWIGTSNGLARFDGLRFKTFRTVDTPELKSNQILSLYQDQRGGLWIGAEVGVVRYDHGQFTPYTSREGLSAAPVMSIGEDHDGRLWVGTQSGLNRWDQTRFVSFFQIDGLPDDRVASIRLLRRGQVVFGTGRGLAATRQGRFGFFQPQVDLPRNRVNSVQQDPQGRLWLADEAGLWRIDPKAATNAAVCVYSGDVSSLLEPSANEIWFGTADGKACRLTAMAEENVVQEVTRRPAAITALSEDREGNVWIGTAGDGLLRLKRRQLHLLNLPAEQSSQEVTALVENNAGALWLAFGAGGIHGWHAGKWQTFRHPQFPEGAFVRTLAEDAQTGLWIGTLGEGLFCWRNERLQRWSQREGLSDSAIEALCADDQGGIWVGTRNGGLNYLQAGQVKRFNTPWGFTGNFASQITAGSDGILWIGTTGDGLFGLSNGTFLAYTTSNGLPHNVVQALHADPEGVLWAGTAGGLARIKQGQLTSFTTKDGIPEDSIFQVQDDNHGNLWVGSNHGLYRLRKQQLHDYAEGRTPFVDAVPYGPWDGLAELQCRQGVQVTRIRGDTGRLWFPTSRGLVWIDPDKLQWNNVPPSVVLEQALVENEAVPLAEPLRVRPGKEKVQFQYTALSLTAPEKVRFRCRLKGFDNDWIDVGSSRMARYTKLSPGQYHFEVLGCNNDGVWNETGARMALIVEPFWWQTVWFKVAVAVAVAGAIGGLVQLRRSRQREIERLRLRIASDLHDEIGSSVWSITLLSQMLHKYGTMGEEERGDVREIHRIATQTANAVRDIVWLINPAFDTVQDLVMRMKDFAGTMLRGVTFQLRSEGVNLSRQLPLDFRQNVFLIYKETVTNIAKHARATRVEVAVEEHDTRWRLIIRDDGVGFDPSAVPSGNGLKNLRRRAEKMAGSVEFETAPRQGTTVVVSLPM